MSNLNQIRMDRVFELAQIAYSQNEIPVGCVIVLDGLVIAEGYNQRQQSNQISDHAEILALNAAGIYLNNWNLSGCEMYLSLEPCLMCYAAIKQSRISKVYIGARQLDQKKSSYRFFVAQDEVIDDSLVDEKFSKIMNDFFIKLRKENNVRY